MAKWNEDRRFGKVWRAGDGKDWKVEEIYNVSAKKEA
jgi:hypothetical protein